MQRDLRELLDDYERRLILLALDAAGGHQRRAAASLGILPSTLSEKMKRLGLRVGRHETHGDPVPLREPAASP
ncbi:MAG: helix-turn-helix domain-containing protein [Vicinamibacteria bacterium]